MHFQMEHMCIRVTGGKQFGLRVDSYSTRAMIYTLESDQSWIQDCWKSKYSPIIYCYQLKTLEHGPLWLPSKETKVPA